MRYFGKDGPQCQFVCAESVSRPRKVRLLCRSVLYGRVPRRMVMWLGMGMLAFSLTLGVLCLGALTPEVDDFHRDMNSSLLIKR